MKLFLPAFSSPQPSHDAIVHMAGIVALASLLETISVFKYNLINFTSNLVAPVVGMQSSSRVHVSSLATR